MFYSRPEGLEPPGKKTRIVNFERREGGTLDREGSINGEPGRVPYCAHGPPNASRRERKDNGMSAGSRPRVRYVIELILPGKRSRTLLSAKARKLV